MSRYVVAGLLALGTGLLVLAAGLGPQRLPDLLRWPGAPNSASLPSTPAIGPHVRGSAGAPVTLEEFGDFECPPCGALFLVLQQVEADSGPNLRVVFHHKPLAMHPHARAAAAAAEAAGLQGQFWEMHDLLYADQAAWVGAPDTQGAFNGYATRLGLDVGRFERDCQSSEVKAMIAADEKRAAELGVKATPTVFINGWVVPRDSYSVGGLRSRVNMMLANLPHDGRELSSAQPSAIPR